MGLDLLLRLGWGLRWPDWRLRLPDWRLRPRQDWR
jgi:hypothetical protein